MFTPSCIFSTYTIILWQFGPFLFANDRKASNIIQQLTLLLLRSPFAASVSIAGIFHPLPDGVLRLRLLNAGQLRSIYDKYDIGLTNINIHVQYGSNLIMSYNVWLFFLNESLWTLCCIQGYQSISEDLGTGDTCTIKDQFVQCEKGTFFDGGRGGGGFYDQNGPNLLSVCILRPHRRTDICVTREK